MANRRCPEIAEVSGMEETFFPIVVLSQMKVRLKLPVSLVRKARDCQSKILVAEQSFHGRTLATLSATGNKRFRRVLRRWFRASSVCHLGMSEAIQEAAIHHPDIVAILIEPIQGEGGVNTAPQGFSYLEEVRALCNQHNWLMMLDEIQTEMGVQVNTLPINTPALFLMMTTSQRFRQWFPIGAVMTQGKAVGLLVAATVQPMVAQCWARGGYIQY